MNERVIIIGAGGQGKVIADIVRLNGDVVLGYLDDQKTGGFNGYDIIGTTRDIGKTDACYFPAVGNNRIRQRIMNSVDVAWYTAIHPTAVIARDVKVGDGTAVMAQAVINSGSEIGRGVIINTAATVDHDNRIGAFAHISPGAHLAGTVTVGERTWIGIGASVCNNVSICDDCTVGGGAAVIRDIEESGTYVGVPAKKKK